MTGFGRASVDPEFGRLRIEARSVNGRHLDVRVTLPRADGELEIRLVRRVRERLERGRVDVTVVEEGGAAGPNVRVNAEAAAAVHRALDELRQRLGLPGSVTLDLVAAQRGVIEAVEAGDPDRTRAAIVRGVDAALDMLEDGRVEEGRALVADLRVQIDLLGAALERLRGLAAAAPEAVRARLRSRLADLLGPESAIDPQRLAAEVTLLAARADIHEEIARARSHVDRVAALLDGGGPVGRKLDFLCQEMGREVNTMGAKLDDGAAIDEVLAMKTAVERIREQAQNLE
jgi:uncharacterized protein (TIGR00255 family)